jgi:hypothetical protein
MMVVNFNKFTSIHSIYYLHFVLDFSYTCIIQYTEIAIRMVYMPNAVQIKHITRLMMSAFEILSIAITVHNQSTKILKYDIVILSLVSMSHTYKNKLFNEAFMCSTIIILLLCKLQINAII